MTFDRTTYPSSELFIHKAAKRNRQSRKVHLNHTSVPNTPAARDEAQPCTPPSTAMRTHRWPPASTTSPSGLIRLPFWMVDRTRPVSDGISRTFSVAVSPITGLYSSVPGTDAPVPTSAPCNCSRTFPSLSITPTLVCWPSCSANQHSAATSGEALASAASTYAAMPASVASSLPGCPYSVIHSFASGLRGSANSLRKCSANDGV